MSGTTRMLTTSQKETYPPSTGLHLVVCGTMGVAESLRELQKISGCEDLKTPFYNMLTVVLE